MPVSGSDIYQVAAIDINDVPSAGGRRGINVIVDGVLNNLWPDITAMDRVTGRVNLRKNFATVYASNDDALGGAYAYISANPSDAAVDAWLVAAAPAPDLASTRQQAALLASKQSSFAVLSGLGNSMFVTGANVITSINRPSGEIEVGDLFYSAIGVPIMGAGVISPASPTRMYAVTAVTETANGALFNIAFTVAPLALWYANQGPLLPEFLNETGPSRPSLLKPAGAICGRAALAAGASSGSTLIDVTRVTAQVWPAGSVIDVGLPPRVAAFNTSVGAGSLGDGSVPIFAPGAAIVIEDGGTRELAVVEKVLFATPAQLRLKQPLINSYGSGATVASVIQLGDLQPGVSLAPFSQQVWTKSFSDSLIGNSIGPQYTGAIALTSIGAETDRWAVVFTGSTAFKVFGERAGEVGTGSTGSDFAPTNPATSQPYFTIPAAGWGSGWQISNVVRFNTRAAASGFWEGRCVSPSPVGSGTVSMTVAVRGNG